MKMLGKLLTIFLVIIVVLFLAKNLIIKAAVQTGVTAVTGLPLKIKTFKVGALSTLVDIQDFKLYNPKDFKKQDPIMIDIPEVYVDYNLLPVFKGKVHLSDMKFHLKELVIVKKADGTTNLDTLKALQAGQKKKPAEKKEEDKPKEKKKPMKMQIDNLSLKIDRVVLKEYNDDGEAKVKEININLNEQHTDIKSLEAVVSLIFFKALSKAGIASVIGFDVGALGDTLTGTLGTAAEAFGETAETGKKALESTTESLKDAKDSLKGLFKK